MSLEVDEVVAMRCGECGIEFWMPIWFQKDRKKTGKAWYCPNGHSRVYREIDADKFRRERDQALQQLAQKNDELLQAAKKLKKLEKRTAAGTCPCCRRTFSNMAQHMRTQHPEFVADHTGKEIPEEHKVVPLRRRRRS